MTGLTTGGCADSVDAIALSFVAAGALLIALGVSGVLFLASRRPSVDVFDTLQELSGAFDDAAFDAAVRASFADREIVTHPWPYWVEPYEPVTPPPMPNCGECKSVRCCSTPDVCGAVSRLYPATN